MTVYELTGATLKLYDLLEGGEIDEQTFNDTLEAMGAEEKIDSCCKVIKQLEANAAALKDEAERLKARATTELNGAKRVRQSLITLLQAANKKSVKTLLFSVSQSARQSVSIADGAEIPKQFLKVKTEVDKTALKKALIDGESIDGVSLETNNSITIR